MFKYGIFSIRFGLARKMFKLVSMPILTLWISIYWGSPLSLKTYYQYHLNSRLCMVYKYVLVPGVILNLYIHASYLIPCDVLHKWGYCNYPYNQGIPRFHQSIRVVKKLTSPSANNFRVQSSIGWSNIDSFGIFPWRDPQFGYRLW